MSFTEELAAFRAAHPDIRTVEAFVTDLNGVVRGKRVPIEHIAKAGEGALRLPLSTLGLDIFGQDVPENALALERGDPDGVMLPIAGALAPMRWSEDTAQLACTLVLPDGSACGFDPRAVLASVVARAVALGFTPVVALELEFYLIDPARPAPPPDPLSGTVLARDQVYDLDIARAFEPVLGAIIEAARALGAPAETAICEFGPGQFEINLGHTSDALAGADHMIWLKRAIRGTARAQGLDATFMAKPFGAASGSGQHIHVSLMGDDTHNALASVPGQGVSPRLGQAVAGLVTTMAEAMAVFAPHANSYRRFVAGSYAPPSA
ncbi:MAG: glutamine synthetase family protein, partial [Pseudomonadota bacterium]